MSVEIVGELVIFAGKFEKQMIVKYNAERNTLTFVASASTDIVTRQSKGIGVTVDADLALSAIKAIKTQQDNQRRR